MSIGPPIVERAGSVVTRDGWSLSVEFSVPEAAGPAPGVVLVPATLHERDGYGPVMLDELHGRGLAVLRMDIRGRGDSIDPMALTSFPPGQRRAVRADVEAALDHLASQPEVASLPMMVMGEQDTADAVIMAATADPRVIGAVLLSGRLSPESVSRIGERRLPLACVTSKEDRRGLRSMVDAYVAADHPASRLFVLDGMGAGTTMFSAWQFLRRDEEPLEVWLAAWAAARLTSR